MSLHASNYNSSEYNNKVSSHRLFQQRCRSRSTQRTAPSTSRPTYSTLLKLQPHYFSSSTSSDSLSSLIKLINHHHYLHIVKGQLAVPSSRSHRPIPPTSISRPRLNHSHDITSDSLSSLIKLINHHQYLHIVEEQLAVPSSGSHRPIPPTYISRRRLNHSHDITSSHPSRKRIITINIK
jgi:hypothetical protein